MRTAPGQLLPRRRVAPALRQLLRRAAEEPADEPPVGPVRVEQLEVDDAGERDDGPQPERARRGREERELTARGVPEQEDSTEVEVMLAGERLDVGKGAPDVVEGAGPAAAWIAQAPVLDVPRRDPVRGEVDAQMAGMGEVVDRLPVPAVHDDGDRMRACARGGSQVAELKRVGPVRNAYVGVGRRGVHQDVRARPHHASSPRSAG